MDFMQQQPNNMQAGQSGEAAKPSPEQLMQKIAIMRSLQQRQQPQQAPQMPPMTR